MSDLSQYFNQNPQQNTSGSSDLSQYFTNPRTGNQSMAAINMNKNIQANNPSTQQNQGFWSKVGGVAKGIGNALTSSEQTFGRGIATAGRELTGHTNQTGNEEGQLAQSEMAILHAIQTTTDPVKKQRLIDYLNRQKTGNANPAFAGITYDPNKVSSGAVTQAEIDPGTMLSNGQVIGSAAGTAMDILSAGSYGKNIIGDTVAQDLAKSGTLMKASEVAGKDALQTGTQQVAKNVGKQLLTHSAEGALQGYGYDVSQNLQQGKTGANALKPGAGTIIGGATPFATKLIGSISKRVLGFTTGAGTDVIQRAIDNPGAVQEAINKYATTPSTKMELVDQATSALQDLARQKNNEYADKLSTLVSDKPIPKSLVTDTFQTAVKDFKGAIDEKGNLVFGDSKLTSTDQTALQNAWNDIKGWKNVTPQGMDELRQKIGSYMKQYKITGNPESSVVLGSVKSALTNYMKDNVQGYKELLANYGNKSDTIHDFAQEFQLAGQAKDTTKLNNLLRIFKKDPQVTANLEKVMGKSESQKFLNDAAGAILSNLMNPSKLGAGTEAVGAGLALFGAHNPGLAAGTLAASSPRIVGTGATTAGKLIQKGIGTAGKRILTREASQIKNSGR